MRAYLNTIQSDPSNADAHFNIARLYEKQGNAASALKHLRTYRRLTETP